MLSGFYLRVRKIMLQSILRGWWLELSDQIQAKAGEFDF